MTADTAGLARCPLFAGLAPAELALVAAEAQPRTFSAGEALCRTGEAARRCWVITGGLVDVISTSETWVGEEVVARHRKGASVGEVALILGEPHSETVIASIPTTALELGAGEMSVLIERFPQILRNALRTHHGRLAHARARTAERAQGETIAVVAGASLSGAMPQLVAATRAASPQSVMALDRQFSFAGALTAADELVAAHPIVLLGAELETETVAALLREADRVVALAGDRADVAQLAALRDAGDGAQVEVVLVGEEAAEASRDCSDRTPLRVIRTCASADDGRLPPADLGWLARHLTRTKLGLALGAGGAKGYAHVGALQVLEEAGYVVDYVAGSSIGAIVGAYLALGSGAGQIDATLRDAFNPPAVAEIFKTSLSGRASGLDLMTALLRETTGERTFADTEIPLTVMAVDLTDRIPAPLREGPLWEALLAATALAGVFPPYERDGHRLVDGLALVPVPTAAVVQDGADVTVSINLIGRDMLASWPGAPPPEPPPERRRRGVLDNLLEVMDLSQLAESVRHAEIADVVVTPRFGPGEWRDFHLADQFLAAGRAAAQEQLPNLEALASPTRIAHHHSDHEGADIDRADTVRL
jgi:NTE family protein